MLMSSTKGILVLLIFLFSGNGLLFSQTLEHPVSVLSGADGPQQATTISDGTLHIVAVMVEFQADTNRFTSGDGTFSEGSIPYLVNDEIKIDPLPHNKTYFEAHLEFAKNYFSKMSLGALDIQYHIPDQVFSLDNEMKAYSPIGVDPTSEPLADLAMDAWEKVAEAGNLNLPVNPGDQIAFAIFHAGVGRDIELTGTTLEKTPQDIPSVYINRDAFQRLFNDPAFSGFPIDNGDLLVDNTLILPRTLTRVGEDITGSEVILQLSINGMVTAQIGSHIGLPDLFNTETGESGIGRFGLMDGAGIFAYSGLFPPELSAWEKIHMGWSAPFEIDYDRDSEIALPASSLGQPGSFGKVSLSSSEYFLIENRHREAGEIGTTLTIQKPDGTSATQTFSNADTSFIFQQSDFTGSLEAGVVVNVSNYDFALPGGPAELLDETSDDDSRILNGGILIWHIDEGIIQNQLANRRGINDNPTRRGVNLMEADGAQDIGRATAIGFFQNEVNGSAFDFWWSGNDASVITPGSTITLYENRFGPDTTPNNDSNSGAQAGFELFGFSENLPTARFQIRTVPSGTKLYEISNSISGLSLQYYTPGDELYWNQYPLSIYTQLPDQIPLVYIPANNGISVYQYQDKTLFSDFEPAFQSIQQPFIDPGNGFVTASPKPAAGDENIDASLLEFSGSQLTETGQLSSSGVFHLVSSPSTNILQFDGTADRAQINSQTIERFFYSAPGHRSEQINGYESSISNDGEVTIQTPSASFTDQVLIPHSEVSRTHIGLIEDSRGGFQTYLLLESDLYYYFVDSGQIERRNIYSSTDFGWPALADFDRSGEVDFLFLDREKNNLQAINRNAAVLPGFPIKAPAGTEFRGTPIIADLDGDERPEILIAGLNSESLNLYAYTDAGEPLEFFPLLVGGISNERDNIINPSMNGNYLSAVSPEGDFKTWHFPDAGTIYWSSAYGNSGNNKATGRLQTDEIIQPEFGILNTSETYNWPNPAQDETFIRFQTAGPGQVQIRVASTSGTLIYDRTLESRGGLPEEIRINTSNWASGGYLAVVSATVNGETERKLVKIAIAR